MVLDEKGSYNKLEKRPAFAGLFVLFWRWSGKHDPIYLTTQFVPLPGDYRAERG